MIVSAGAGSNQSHNGFLHRNPPAIAPAPQEIVEMNVDAYSIIVPVWGSVHVARFLDWVIPSWLSPLNIPHLASSATVDLILLTSRADQDGITRHPIVEVLAAHCKLRFVEIDDLIPGGIPTVTLSLAFARGVTTALDQARKPNIIFLNADFLLSDGSLASVAKRFEAGQQILLCPSIRVIETQVMPEFDRMRHSDGSMTVPAREAVRLALGALHPTVIACRVDQPLLQSSHPNQFFWRVDSTTLLLRAFLLFPLAVTPKKAPDPVDTYCDYGWIATLAPDAPIDIVQTTDEFFAIELAPEGQELGFVRPGAVDLDDIAHRISVWANDFSRAQPLTALVFSSADVSKAALDRTVTISQTFIADLLGRLGPAQPLSNHSYWIGGATSYLDKRRKIGVNDIPPEMAPLSATPNQDFTLNSRIRSWGARLLLGRPGARRLWHPYRNAERVTREMGPSRVVGSTQIPNELNIVKSETGTPLAAINSKNLEDKTKIISNLAAAVDKGGRARLIVGFDAREFSELLGAKERAAVLVALDPFFRIVSATDLVTAFEAQVIMRHRYLAGQLHLVTRKRSLRLVAASAVAMVNMAFANLGRSRTDSALADAGVASLLLELQRHPS
jgi:hypothetical protein